MASKKVAPTVEQQQALDLFATGRNLVIEDPAYVPPPEVSERMRRVRECRKVRP